MVNGECKWGYVRYFLDLCVLILFTFRWHLPTAAQFIRSMILIYYTTDFRFLLDLSPFTLSPFIQILGFYWTYPHLLSPFIPHLLQILGFYWTYPHLPSNALEAHFRHINEVCAIHCVLTRSQKQKLITSIVLASSIAPKEETLQLLFKNRH